MPRARAHTHTHPPDANHTQGCRKHTPAHPSCSHSLPYSTATKKLRTVLAGGCLLAHARQGDAPQHAYHAPSSPPKWAVNRLSMQLFGISSIVPLRVHRGVRLVVRKQRVRQSSLPQTRWVSLNVHSTLHAMHLLISKRFAKS